MLDKDEIKNWILYEDDALLVVNKPAGIATESAGVMEADLYSRLRFYLDGAKVHIVHRLDQPVEGLLVFAKTGKAAAALSAQLTDGRMTKLYTARVSGAIPKEADTLIDYLTWDRKQNLSRIVGPPEAPEEAGSSGNGGGSSGSFAGRGRQGRNGGSASVMAGNSARAKKGGRDEPKRAVLHYRRAGSGELLIRLETGRHHQIRAQLAHAGMPIRGDRKYGGEPWPRLCLCASSLKFRHPGSGKRMTFSVVPDFNG